MPGKLTLTPTSMYLWCPTPFVETVEQLCYRYGNHRNSHVECSPECFVITAATWHEVLGCKVTSMTNVLAISLACQYCFHKGGHYLKSHKLSL